MNQEDAAEFSRAVALAQAGNKTRAYQDLKELFRKTGSKDFNLLLWIAFTSPDLNEAEAAIRAAENQQPGDSNVLAARQWLQQEKLKSPAPVSPATTVQEFKTPPPTESAGFQVKTVPVSSEFKRPSEIMKAATQAQDNGWSTPAQPDLPTLRDTLVKGKRQFRLSTLAVLAIALGVLAVVLIGWAVFYFVSNPGTALSDTAFDKAGLPIFSNLDKLELTQSMKDQLSNGYANPQLLKNGVKVTQVDFYKIKTTSSAADFTSFYKSEMDKAGWNVQSVPVPTVSPQPFLLAIKSHSYFLLGSVVSTSNGLTEIKAQLEPNQAVAFAMLFEQTQPTTNP